MRTLIKLLKAKNSFLNQKGMSLIQTMVMVGVLGTMTTVFVREADLMNKQTRILNVQSRTDEITKEITSYLSNTAAVQNTLSTTATASNSCNSFASLPNGLRNSSGGALNLQTPLVTISAVDYCIETSCPFPTTNPAPYKCGDLYPGEAVYRLRFTINRSSNATAQKQSIVTEVDREIKLRVFRTAGTVHTGYPEESEAYYSRLFCENIGGWINEDGTCNNQFDEKSCVMMGGVWDKSTNTCLKDEITCEWLTGSAACWMDPGDGSGERCMFPTEGAWTYQDQTWSTCNSCQRIRTATCATGQCNQTCQGSPPSESTADIQGGGNWKTGDTLPYGSGLTGATHPAYLDDPPTCKAYGRYNPVGGQYCAGANDCRRNVACQNNTCANCDPNNRTNSPINLTGLKASQTELTTTGGYANINNNSTCGNDGSWSIGDWGACNPSTCEQTRSVTAVPGICGAAPTSAQPTTTQACTITGVAWTQSGWGACSNCYQSQTVTCSNTCGSCDGPQPPSSQFCGPVTNGGWSSWSTVSYGAWGAWSSCSVTCPATTGSQTRYRDVNQTRTCDNPSPTCSGTVCSGSSTQTIANGSSETQSCTVTCP